MVSRSIGLLGCASPVFVADNLSVTYQKVARVARLWDIVANGIYAVPILVF